MITDSTPIQSSHCTITDGGSTTHGQATEQGLFDVEDCNVEVQGIGSTKYMCTRKGKRLLYPLIQGREAPPLVITEVLVGPWFPTALISEIKATASGFMIIKTPPPNSAITFSKNGTVILEAYQLSANGLYYVSEYIPRPCSNISCGTITEHTFLTDTTTATAINAI